MKRVLVFGVGADVLGGIETFLFNMSSFFSKDTILDYIIEGTDTVHKKTIENKKGRIFFIAPKRKMLSNLHDWKTLLKGLRKEYDTIYFNMFSLAWLFPILKARHYKYRVFVHAHNSNLHNCGFLQKALHSINRTLQKPLRITRLTNSSSSSAFFFGKSKSMLIYNAVDLKRFSFNPNKRSLIRNKLKIKDSDHLYGFSGRLSYEKNCFFLLDVFKELSVVDCCAKFVICGDGKQREAIQNRAKEYNLDVIFPGVVSNIEDYYSAMDSFVLPSRFEGLGIVLIESQANGLLSFSSKGVVPTLAKQTDLLHFIDLKDGAQKWASIIYNLSSAKCNRTSPINLNTSRFNIVNEAPYLEKVLTDGVD